MSERREFRSVAEVMSESPIECVNILYTLMSQMPDELVIPAIQTALDEWFAVHGLTEEEALSIYDKMREAAEGCYKAMGLRTAESEIMRGKEAE